METVAEVTAEIDRRRQRLSEEAVVLRSSVEQAVNWRAHFDARPYVWLSASLVGGVVLGSLLSGQRSSRLADSSHSVPRFVDHAWAAVSGALVESAVDRLAHAIDGLVPGFHEHFEQRMPPRARS